MALVVLVVMIIVAVAVAVGVIVVQYQLYKRGKSEVPLYQIKLMYNDGDDGG